MAFSLTVSSCYICVEFLQLHYLVTGVTYGCDLSPQMFESHPVQHKKWDAGPVGMT